MQAPGAVKKEKKSEKNPKKIKKIEPVPIYVFVDSEQKTELKAKIKPCSHQLNCLYSRYKQLSIIFDKYNTQLVKVK